MGKTLRTHRSTFHSLQVIVADSRRGLQTGCDVGIVDDISLFRAVRPHPCKAIRLQFEIDGERVSLRRILAG